MTELVEHSAHLAALIAIAAQERIECVETMHQYGFLKGWPRAFPVGSTLQHGLHCNSSLDKRNWS